MYRFARSSDTRKVGQSKFSALLQAALLVAMFVALSAPRRAFGFKPETGQLPAPLDKHLEYVDGTPLDLAALRGKPTVLYFGADWCAPCVERGRPATIAVAKKYAPQGLQVVFVSMDDNNFRENKVREERLLGVLRIAMARMDKCPPGRCLEGTRDLGDFGRIYVYPTAIVLDAGGVVRYKMDHGMGVQGGLEEAATAVMQSAGLLATKQK